MGIPYFEKLLPSILQNTLDPRITVKEGYIGMFVYFPIILEESFSKYLKDVLDCIVESIAEENENLRNLSLRVVKIFIQKFGVIHQEVLLEPVNEGLFSTNWRKRHSSIQLMGEMLDALKSSNKDHFLSLQMDRILVSVYILRHDDVDCIKVTATNVIDLIFIIIIFFFYFFLFLYFILNLLIN